MFGELAVKNHIPVQSHDDQSGKIRHLEIFDDFGAASDENGIGKLVSFGVRFHFALLVDRIDRKNLDFIIAVQLENFLKVRKLRTAFVSLRLPEMNDEDFCVDEIR